MSVTRETAASDPGVGQPAAPIAHRGAAIEDLDVLRARVLGVAPKLVVIVAVALVAAGQLAEDFADSAPLQMFSPITAIRRWTVILAVLYMLLTSHAVDRLVKRSLVALEGTLGIQPERFRAYALRMRQPSLAAEAGLLAISGIVVVVLFSVLGASLPIDDPVTNQPMFLPPSGIADLLVLSGYTLLGWALVSLVYTTIRRARSLGQLSHEPLPVDVFDTTNLLPLGNIALATSLAPAGIMVIFLLGFGRPNALTSWAILLLAMLASVLAMLLPLRGIHGQMLRTKRAVLRELNAQIRQLHEQIVPTVDFDGPETMRLNNRATLLISLRKTVEEMTSWPFRDGVTFGRAVLIASAPLIYTIASELIKAFWITPLTH